MTCGVCRQRGSWEQRGQRPQGCPGVCLASLRLGPGPGQLRGVLRGKGRSGPAGRVEAGCPRREERALARLPTARQYHLQGWMTPRAAATPTRGEAPGSEERQQGQGPGMAGEWLGECGPCPPCGPSGGRPRQGGGNGLSRGGGLAVCGLPARALWAALPRGLCARLEGQGPEWGPLDADVAEGLGRAGRAGWVGGGTSQLVEWGGSGRHTGLCSVSSEFRGSMSQTLDPCPRLGDLQDAPRGHLHGPAQAAALPVGPVQQPGGLCGQACVGLQHDSACLGVPSAD